MRRHWLVAFAMLCLVVFLPAKTWAVQPDEVLRDEKLEHRAREISAELRCLVCQNQSIDDSDASLARDLRLLVRERLQSGDSNQQVIDYIVGRYGEFVLLRPVFQWHTAALWATPAAVLILGVYGLYAVARRRKKDTVPPLNAEEQEALAALLKHKE